MILDSQVPMYSQMKRLIGCFLVLLLLAPAREEMLARALPPVRDVPLVAAHFGEDAGLVGAAIFAREAVAQRAPA